MWIRALSFATHGLIAGELGASNAGLVLTPPRIASDVDDGLLTTSEIAGLRLDADFVILSACNTAAGSAEAEEGLSGLASAFFLAGARSLLVSHWPVYSDAATELTTEMVNRLSTDPDLDPPEALRRAMLAILDDPAVDDCRRRTAQPDCPTSAKSLSSFGAATCMNCSIACCRCHSAAASIRSGGALWPGSSPWTMMDRRQEATSGERAGAEADCDCDSTLWIWVLLGFLAASSSRGTCGSAGMLT